MQAGRNEAVDFETYTEVIVIMPGAVVQRGGPVPSVADGEYDQFGMTYCSETWNGVGPEAKTDYDECDNFD
ncbi:Surface protein [Natrarchaeobaculum sulfurireducens]|uniref:Surface protein n=1 Tax=Natrarchaeobaculum sulfurireducens TaxID=2044521 RepID=A0A346PFN8_9EURY|nr:Surface protein [Natrarchaeobaculum sulfurireducens]